MEDVTDDILKEKMLRDLTRAQSQLFINVFTVIPGGEIISFQHPHLVEYLLTDKVIKRQISY